jgi:hypothetical protein
MDIPLITLLKTNGKLIAFADDILIMVVNIDEARSTL